MRGKVIALCLVCAMGAAGCAMRRAAAPDRASLPAVRAQDFDWPARWTEDLDQLAGRMPDQLSGQIMQFEVDESGAGALVRKSMPYADVTARRATPSGVLLEVNYRWEMWRNRPASTWQSLRFLSWLSDPAAEDDALAESLAATTTGTSGTLFIPENRDPVGLAVFLGGGVEYDWALRWDMLAQGWAIIQSGTDAKPIGAQWEERFVVDSEHPVSAVAPQIAQRVDDQIAEDVYAAEAFILFARDRCPALRSAPLVVVGLSRGSFSLPALVARLDSRVDAAVIVGGGANLPAIAMATALKQPDLVLSGPLVNGKASLPDPTTRRELLDAYLASSELDPYHTAASLNAAPTLVLQGMFDRVVPATTGKVLYKRLGRPERWTYPLGHGGVFWMLKNDRRRLIAWIDAHTLEARLPAVATPSGGQ